MFRAFLKTPEDVWKKWLSYCKAHPRTSLALRVSIIFALFWLICYNRLDPDFGWHLQSGNYFRKFGIPLHDVFTYTAHNFPWIDHEWGNDVITSFLYQWGGYLLISPVFAALWTSALFMNAKKLPFPVLWLAAIATLPYAGIRPMVWTILGLAVLLRISSSKRENLKYLIPIGFMLWCNLQGGFIVGLAYLGYLLVKEKKLYWGWILLASALATFVNPYGPRLYVEIFRTLSDRQIHHQIKEWSYFYIPRISALYLLLWAVGFWVFAKKYLRNWLSFTMLLLLATFSASRNLPLFVISSIKDFGSYFADARKRMPKRLDTLSRTIVGIAVYGLVIFCIVISIWEVKDSNDKSTDYPVQAVAYLSAHPCSGNLFNSYNYGGYLIWKLPSQPVYIDGRMPSWKQPNGIKYLDTYFSILNSQSVQQQQFSEYNVRCALLTNNSSSLRLIDSLEGSGWIACIQANGSVLLLEPK